MMSTRRDFLKALSVSPLAFPVLPHCGFSRPRSLDYSGLPSPGDPAYWKKVRGQFLLAEDKVFFNAGTHGAMPRVVVEAVHDHLLKCATDIADWDYRGADWIAGYQPWTGIRAKAARLINADVKEFALAENATCAITLPMAWTLPRATKS
ncbi:MAG: hypothetical protein WBC70_04505 [Candidatus Aminicenantales bacterium]